MNKTRLTVRSVRNQLFLLWCGLLILYVAVFLATVAKAGIELEDSSDAAWKVAYLMVPVLGAFGGYWFSNEHREQDARKTVSRDRRMITMVLTSVLHAIVFMWIVVGIYAADFADVDRRIDFHKRADAAMKVLLLVWSTTLLPVSWLLQGEESRSTKVPTA